MHSKDTYLRYCSPQGFLLLLQHVYISKRTLEKVPVECVTLSLGSISVQAVTTSPRPTFSAKQQLSRIVTQSHKMAELLLPVSSTASLLTVRGVFWYFLLAASCYVCYKIVSIIVYGYQTTKKYHDIPSLPDLRLLATCLMQESISTLTIHDIQIMASKKSGNNWSTLR